MTLLEQTAPPPETRLVGIFGTGRNGSTLLLRLLDGIPGTYVHPVESNFLSAINDVAHHRTVRNSVRKNVTTHPLRYLGRPVQVTDLLKYYAYHQREIESEVLAQLDAVALGKPPFTAFAVERTWLASEFVPAFLRAFTEWLQPGSVPALAVFKTIETPYIADYERLFPTMRFIHIMRDPVEMWSSQKRSLVQAKGRPPWYLGMDNLSACIERRWIPHARTVMERLESPRHYVLRYEDLLSDPAATMNRLVGWLGGLAPVDATKQTVLGGRHPKRMDRNVSLSGAETPREVVADLKARYHYADIVSDRERDLVIRTTKKWAARLGYTHNECRVSGPSLAWRWLYVDQWDFQNVHGVKSWVLAAASFLVRRVFALRQSLQPLR